jgi:hypothetical protein
MLLTELRLCANSPDTLSDADERLLSLLALARAAVELAIGLPSAGPT